MWEKNIIFSLAILQVFTKRIQLHYEKIIHEKDHAVGFRMMPASYLYM